MSTPKISIIVPVFNEAAHVAAMADEIKSTIKKVPFEFELIFVDDGSNDGSYEVLKNIAGIKVLRHPDNLGYGAALKTAIRHSTGEWILIIDADGTYEAADIGRLLEHIGDYDMVVGARTGDKVKIPAERRPIKWFLNILANYLTRTKIPDLNSGLRIFRKEIAQEFIKILPNGFSFTSTITLAMLTNDYLVKYISVNYHLRAGKSKIRPVRDAYNFIVLIIRTVMYFSPLKIFMPVSIFFILASVGVFFYSWLLTSKIMDQTVAVLFTTGIEVGVIGLLADLIDKRGLS